jgi:nucleoid-associated protein YgaU
MIPTARVAPVPSPGSGSAQIESYDEETYTCKSKDTFRSISQTYYKTDRYEQALLLFNRNHPLAVDSLGQDPPSLRAGQSVYLPPTSNLEKYYGSAIPKETTAAAAPVVPEASVIIRPPVVSPAVSAGTGAAPAPAPERTYRVRANGEMYREIARRTLGDSERWSEIYKLNQKYDPRDPIPAGTELRLPADARVDGADLP